MGEFRRTWTLIYSDYRRYRATGRGSSHPLAVLLLVQGFWASSIYRLARYVLPIPSVAGYCGRSARGFFMLAQKGMEILTGISLPPETEIGPGLYIGHFGGIIVSGRVRIGANCNLSQGVTLGLSRAANGPAPPLIGDRVYIGPQAILIGGPDRGE